MTCNYGQCDNLLGCVAIRIMDRDRELVAAMEIGVRRVRPAADCRINGCGAVHGFNCHGEDEPVGRAVRTCDRKDTCDGHVLMSGACDVACDGEETII
jgi:hypothetical protein